MAFHYYYLIFLMLPYIGVDATVLHLYNKCNVTICAGIQAGAGRPQLLNGGCKLAPGQAVHVNAPQGWSGRIWPRSGCSFDRYGHGTCLTGDCGAKLQCSGAGGIPPATLAEFTLHSPLDYYDISLVDGFNIPMNIFPLGSRGKCKKSGCPADINKICPGELQVRSNGEVIACKSACLAFNKPEYCCTGAYGSPDTCKSSNYSRIFKKACPDAYSYAYDDRTSSFTCNGADYLVRFC